jgi:hypothetical protein
VRHFAIVGVSEFQSVVPLAFPVEKTRHALQHIVFTFRNALDG